MTHGRTGPDKDCYTLPNGECIAPYCSLHGGIKMKGQRPDYIDECISVRLRQRRSALDLKLVHLAACVGVTYQQVHKYETGQNRISASMLWKLAKALNVPVSYFYEGLDR